MLLNIIINIWNLEQEIVIFGPGQSLNDLVHNTVTTKMINTVSRSENKKYLDFIGNETQMRPFNVNVSIGNPLEVLCLLTNENVQETNCLPSYSYCEHCILINSSAIVIRSH